MEAKRDVKLNHTRMKEAGFANNSHWEVVVEQGTNKEDIETPSFWSHVAAQFSQGDTVDVRIDNESFYAQIYIKECDRTYAQVKVLQWYELAGDPAKMKLDMEDYAYKYRGPHCKHSVIRKSDEEVMVEHLASKEQALKWIDDHKRTIAA